MGVALSRSKDPNDQALWKDWYAFTVELASNGCFAEDETERNMAREFVRLTIGDKADEAFESESSCRTILGALEPDRAFLLVRVQLSLRSCCRRQLAKEIIGRPFGGRISSTQPVLLNQRRGPPPLRPKSRGVYSVLGGDNRNCFLRDLRPGEGRASVHFKLRELHRQYLTGLSLLVVAFVVVASA